MKNQIDESLLNKNNFYIVAVSGGPDSMYLLNQLYEKNYNIVVCHINYQKRTNSNLDEILVKDYCDKRKIKLFIKQVNKQDYQQYKAKSSNFQEIARLIRYDFFATTLSVINAQAILIAHNLTDHIETFLIQNQRNTKLTYYGLNVKTTYNYENETVQIFRPMLKVKREYIIETLKTNNIDYILDYTNELDIYQRNRIRKDIIDNENIDIYLKQIDNKNEALNHQIKQVDIAYKQVVVNNRIDLKIFSNLEHEIQERIIFNYFKSNNFLSKIIKLKKQRIKELVKQLIVKKPNIIFRIDDEVTVIKSFGEAFFINNEFLKTNTVIIEFAKSFVWNNIQFAVITKNEKWNEKLTPFNHFYLSDSDFPITITNDIKVTKKVNINKNCVNRYFINNKVRLDKRFLNPIIFNKDNNFILFKDSKINNLYLKQQSYLFMIK